MAGTPLDEFTTLMASQGPAWARGPEVIVNDVVKNTYTLNRFVTGKNVMEMVQGGDQITDTIFLDAKSTFQRYNPNVEFTYQNPQTGTTWTVPWAFAAAHMSWTKHELGLNKDTTTKKYRAQRYKSVMWQKHQNLKTDISNSLEEEIWAQPDQVNMESSSPTSPRVPYSIPVFINEFANGLPHTTVDVSGATWTTVMGIDPTVAGNEAWKPLQVGYAVTNYTSASNVAPLFQALSAAFHKTSFDRLPYGSEYSDARTTPNFFATSLNGLTNFETALRVSQDLFSGMGKVGGQDPDYPGPKFRGKPLVYISELDTATIHSDGTNAVAEESASGVSGSHISLTYGSVGSNIKSAVTGGGVSSFYYAVSGLYMKCVVHSENYLVLTDPITPSKQPFSRVQVADIWNNFICRSRRRHAIVVPMQS